MTIILAKVVQTCSACPSQWDAWTIDGNYLYLRYRCGVGTADTYDSADWEIWPVPPDGAIARFNTGDNLDGMISLDDFMAASGLKLSPNAEVS